MLPTIDLALADGVELDEKKLLESAQTLIAKTVELANLSYPEGAELSLVIAGDKTLRQLNHEWRNKDKPTNVLSFPGQDMVPGDKAGLILGDIIISLETTKREAALENKSVHDHFSHLIVHGFLHLFGYDHETDAQAAIMERLETRILGELGIANPYEDE